ncbi:MAG: type II toxin-antitoxin system HicA family toxin [Dehalobacterium sp.]
MWERKADGRTYFAPIVLCKEIPLGTLKSILRQMGISEKEFIQHLGVFFLLTQAVEGFASNFISIMRIDICVSVPPDP